MAHTFNFDTLYPGDQPFAVVFDVETTGLIRGEGRPTKKKLAENDRDYPRIVSLSWIVLSRNYRAVRNGSHIIQQQKKIPKKVIEIHGITDAIAKENGQPLDLVLEQFSQDIAVCDYFVGFNVMFDKYVVEAECIRCGIKSPFTKKRKYDVMAMGRSFMERKWFKLKDLVKESRTSTQLSPSSFHNSDFDTVVTAALFCAFHKTNRKY